MSKSSRYHHGDLRNALLGVGLGLARDGGPDAVTIRQAARAVGVTPAAAYRHFDSREALLAEVARLSRQKLAEAMMEALAAAEDEEPRTPLFALYLLGKAYIQFAKSESGWVITGTTQFDDAAVTGRDQGAEDVAHPIEMVSQIFDDLVARGEMDPTRRPGAELLVCSTIHGLAMLIVRLHPGPSRLILETSLNRSLEDSIDQVFVGLAYGLGICEPEGGFEAVAAEWAQA